MNTPKQLKGASVNLLILAMLQKSDCYGYEMALHLEKLSEGKLKWKAVSMYPVLKKMEQAELIEAYWKIEGFDRPRKYYRILEKGIDLLEKEKKEWELMHSLISKM